jgi:hypothetical protein
MAEAVWSAAETLRETTEWLIAQDDLTTRFAGAVPYLNGFARVLGASLHLAAAQSGDPARIRLARFYIRRMLPDHTSLLAQVREGGDTLFDLSNDDLA